MPDAKLRVAMTLTSIMEAITDRLFEDDRYQSALMTVVIVNLGSGDRPVVMQTRCVVVGIVSDCCD